MVNFCAVYGCGKKAGKFRLSFFRFPAVKRGLNDGIQTLQRKRRDAWLKAVKRKDLSEEKCRFARICSEHFLSGKPADLYDTDNPDWAPNIKLGYTSSQRSGKDAQERYERATKRRKKLFISETLDSSISLPACEASSATEDQLEDFPNEGVLCETRCSAIQTMTIDVNSVSTQTDMTMNDLKMLENDNISSNSERYKLQMMVDSLLYTEDSFRSNPEKLSYFTGVPTFALFMLLLKKISPHVTVTATSSLGVFQQLLLTMMKLRLNCPYTDLGYRFNVSRVTVSRIFKNIVNVLHTRLYYLIHWPERDSLRETMPTCFREVFGKTIAVIIDCFEVQIDRPSNLMARAQTWSSYKHRQTVKFLIGISPQGFISFISKAWGGRSSDKHITEECGILNKLLPGDVILADRGFNVAEEVGLYYATVKIPAFTKGKHQLHPSEVEETRKIASVRIHVERVIGVLRQKFRILMGPLSVEMLNKKEEESEINRIVHVCCAITNLCNSVVPFD